MSHTNDKKHNSFDIIFLGTSVIGPNTSVEMEQC